MKAGFESYLIKLQLSVGKLESKAFCFLFKISSAIGISVFGILTWKLVCAAAKSCLRQVKCLRVRTFLLKRIPHVSELSGDNMVKTLARRFEFRLGLWFCSVLFCFFCFFTWKF